jgi:hypothetical protein
MPERTGAHCLYDRFAAAVRRQITIAISGSLRKKPPAVGSGREPEFRVRGIEDLRPDPRRASLAQQAGGAAALASRTGDNKLHCIIKEVAV